MANQVSGKRKPKEKIKQSTSQKKGIQSSVASVYFSSEEVTLCDKKSSISKMRVTEDMTYGIKKDKEYSFIQDINVKSDTDVKDCFITGMTLVLDNQLVLCDANNLCLKLFDINKNIIKDVLPLQSIPFGITTVSNDQIAVVLQSFYQIQLVNVRAKLTQDRSIKTNGYCLDVKMINDQLYVSYKEPVKFQIIQLTGEIVRTIKPDDELRKHCKLPRHIAVSHDESVIYVSDWYTNKVMSLDMNGNMLSLFQGKLQVPQGIFISPSESVYVCNKEQHTVYEIMSDLRKTMVILGPGDGLYFPKAMCFNKINQHLYISSRSPVAKYRNILKVYRY
ncbi:uncharacterized protein LOC132726257 [Ruditapes philippinarum]|uniref:uncharacterized protein LOC132726257 n=1 Tax=Ruditapes philippinarum TaxID=129788 RepID=UPI00295B65FD|nr:uncharacterized protein LOC132726257 [Ruditapes philippinarum]